MLGGRSDAHPHRRAEQRGQLDIREAEALAVDRRAADRDGDRAAGLQALVQRREELVDLLLVEAAQGGLGGHAIFSKARGKASERLFTH